jgi:uncharacterized flavoprotein (TIGR03862 family)
MSSPVPVSRPRIAVIGGGPAGLMAAEVCADAGLPVDLFDAMPSVARKFLLAGKGGMNITHAEPYEQFVSRYGTRAAQLRPLLDAFGPAALREWIHGLGIDTFVGSSDRVFPTDMKAAPLLRAWLHRLRASGVVFHPRHRWSGWQADGALRFATPAGEHLHTADATILALGGGSWAKLGSDGAWVPLLAAAGAEVAPLRPANCGFDAAWSEHFRARFAGEPVKAVAARVGGSDKEFRRGEFVVTTHGVEGSLVYALSSALRNAIDADGSATLELDLLPDHAADRVSAEVARPRGARSLASHLQSRLGLKGVKVGLLREVLGADGMHDPARLAATIKALPVRLLAPRPLDEAISCAGGVRFEALDARLMLRARPGLFCAGEMLDWEAPTGGYLLTACFASGRAAARGALDWLRIAPGATGHP